MSQFRVMTWNVQNLFEVGAEDGPDTTAEFNEKLRSLAELIDRTRPHIVALQELGTEPALVALQEALQWSMPHRMLGVPDGRGIRVGFLSTRVLRDPVFVRPFPPGLLPIQAGDDPEGPDGPRMLNQMGRGALQVSVRANNRDVRLVTCHMKSKLLTFPGGRFSTDDEDERARFGSYALFRRATEATTLQAHVNHQLLGHGDDEAVVLLGDMNDEAEAATTQILHGPPGSEIGTLGFDRPDRGDPKRMWNLAPMIPEPERWSRVYRGRPELIDHIFASQFLVNAAAEVQTYTAHGQPLPSIDDDPNARQGEPGSDHAAIMATFDF